jgi:hypothetical protein
MKAVDPTLGVIGMRVADEDIVREAESVGHSKSFTNIHQLGPEWCEDIRGTLRFRFRRHEFYKNPFTSPGTTNAGSTSHMDV